MLVSENGFELLTNIIESKDKISKKIKESFINTENMVRILNENYENWNNIKLK